MCSNHHFLFVFFLLRCRIYRSIGRSPVGVPAAHSSNNIFSIQDVVPEGKVESWSHDPFLGEIVHDDDADQDFIFGRGAIDDKQVRVPVLSSITNLTKWQNNTHLGSCISWLRDLTSCGRQHFLWTIIFLALVFGRTVKLRRLRVKAVPM